MNKRIIKKNKKYSNLNREFAFIFRNYISSEFKIKQSKGEERKSRLCKALFSKVKRKELNKNKLKKFIENSINEMNFYVYITKKKDDDIFITFKDSSGKLLEYLTKKPLKSCPLKSKHLKTTRVHFFRTNIPKAKRYEEEKIKSFKVNFKGKVIDISELAQELSNSEIYKDNEKKYIFIPEYCRNLDGEICDKVFKTDKGKELDYIILLDKNGFEVAKFYKKK